MSAIVVADQTVLEVIHLKHRTTDEIIPLIDPFLNKQGILKGVSGKLIIRTTPENLLEIKELLTEIDTVRRQLIITVKQNVDKATARRLLRLHGRVSKGEAQVKISSYASNKGLINNNSFDKNRLNVQVQENQNLISDINTQRIQVLDGGRALIHLGKSLPITLHNSINTPQGTRIIRSTQFRDATIGFFVIPSVNGNKVSLEINSQRNTSDHYSQGAINVQQINTLISGKLGEWMHLGLIESGRSNWSFSPNSPLNDRTTSEQRIVLIKVDEIH